MSTTTDPAVGECTRFAVGERTSLALVECAVIRTVSRARVSRRTEP